MVDDNDDGAVYCVVVNHEEQYSIWPEDRDVPAGWHREGTTGSRRECLDYIDEVWTDIRPLSLRRFLAERQREAAHSDGDVELLAEVEPLPVRLSRIESPIEAVAPAPFGLAGIRAAIEQGHLCVRFTDTEGGTELGIPIDPERSVLSAADLAGGAGAIRVVGTLTLDFIPIRCHADIDLPTLTGRARVELLPRS